MAVEYSLDKEWRFRLHDEAEEKQYHHDTAIDFYGVKCGWEGGYAAWALDDSSWRRLDVPHDVCMEMPFTDKDSAYHGAHVRPSCWYRKTFSLDPALKGKHLTVVFDSIAVNGKIWFNGSLMRSSFSPYGQVVLDITDKACFDGKANVLAVYIDGTAFEGWFYEGVGICQSVHLYVREPVHIAHNGVYFKPVHIGGDNWELETAVEVENSAYAGSEACTLRVELEGYGSAEAAVTAAAGEKSCVRIVLPVKAPKLWDVKTPKLYKAAASLWAQGRRLDSASENIGFRTLRFDADRGFLLNGRPLKIKGMCCHGDHAGVGMAVPAAVAAYRIGRLKEMGCNAYRSAHNPPSKDILDICDRVGMLVMSEVRRFEVSEENRQLLENMVKTGRNHPCVFLWGLFNEETVQGTPEGERIFFRLYQWVRRLDDTRPVTGSADNGWFTGSGCVHKGEVSGISYNFKDLPLFRQKYPHRPVVSPECGSIRASRGCFCTDSEKGEISSYRNQEDWRTDVEEMWAFTKAHDWMSGFFMWSGFDYHGESVYPAVCSYYGRMDMCGFPKTGFYEAQACFADRPVLHIVPHWNRKPGETVPVRVIANLPQAELFLNGRSLGRKAAGIGILCEWKVPFEAGELTAVGYEDGAEMIRTSVFTAGKPALLRAVPAKDAVACGGSDALVVNVYAQDAEGHICPCACSTVHFETNWEIIGVGNGCQTSHEREIAPQRRLYNGCCQVILRAVADETLWLTARAEGLMPARVSVPADAAGTCLSLGETDQKQPGFYMSQRFFDQQPEVSRLNDPEYVGEMRPVITNMNRFQPAQGGKWRVFRTNIALRADNPHPYAALTFEHMYGERLAVYDGERCVYDGEPAFGLRVELERRGRNDIPIFLLIKAAPDAPAAGFKRRVLQSTSAFPMSPASQMAAGEALRKDNFF